MVLLFAVKGATTAKYVEPSGMSISSETEPPPQVATAATA